MSTSTVVIPSNYTSMTNLTANTSYPITRAYTNTSSTTYTQLNVSKKNTTGTAYFTGFDFSTIPANATIVSVTIKARCMVSSTSYISSASVQAYKGSSAVGSASNFRTTTATTYTLSSGTWSRADLDNLRIFFSATRGNTNSTCYMRIYGMDVTVVWDAPTEQMYTKVNGTWTAVSEVYKKVNGSWVLQSTLEGLFDTTKNYIKG